MRLKFTILEMLQMKILKKLIRCLLQGIFLEKRSNFFFCNIK